MLFQSLLECVTRGTPGVWVSVCRTRGSAPREAGAGMLVTPDGQSGTIGGGHLEWKAVELARERIALGQCAATLRHYPLGPALGQCCGGSVDLLFRPVDHAARPWVEALAHAESEGGTVELATRVDAGSAHTCLAAEACGDALRTSHGFDPWHVWVFGAGHVGRAVERVFGALECRLTWVDARDEAFPHPVASNVRVLASDLPHAEVRDIRPGADVLVLTHSHVLDFEIVHALLGRDDLGCIGMIGSATKAARFRRRLAARGVDAAAIARLTCPVGRTGGADKHPGTIAVGIATQLLALRGARRHAAAGAAS